MALTPGIVGRERELSLLEEMRTDAARGKGGVLLMSGDGGVGKTRLATHLARSARDDGWHVMVGRAYELETQIPYAPFADACEPVLATFDGSVLTRLTRGDRSVLTTLAPSLAGNSTVDVRSDVSSAAEQHVRLHTGILQLLRELAKKQPLLLVLENMQWADVSTIELFHFLARQVEGHRILLVGTWNETERELPDALRTMVRSLRQLNAASDVRLDPLSLEAVGQLVAQRFDVEAPTISGFVSALHDATRGNPFFVEQVLAELIARGTLRKVGGAWVGWHVEQLVLPNSVYDVMSARLARLGVAARQVADVIAVAGMATDHDVIDHVLRDGDRPLDGTALLSALDELRVAGIVVENADSGSVTYDMAHPMLRQAFSRASGAAREQALHARIATALEAWHGDKAERHAEQIAAHWRVADPKVNPRASVRWLLLAGRQAMERLARREAAAAFRAALKRADDYPDVVDAEAVPTLLDELSRLYRRLGEYQEAINVCTRARDLALAHGDEMAVALAERRLGLAHEGLGQRKEAIEHFDVGIARARANGATMLLARLLLAKGDSLQALGLPNEARREITLALDLAEEAGEQEMLARAHRSLLKLHTWSGPADRAWVHARSAVALAEASGARNLAWSAHWTTSVLAGFTSNTESVKHHLERATKLAVELHSPLLQLRTAEISLEFRSAVGEWDKALEQGEPAIVHARALDQTTLLARLLYWVGIVYLNRGETVEAQKLFSEAWTIAGADGIDVKRPFEVHGILPAYSARVIWLSAIGEHAQAISLGHEALAIADQTGYVAWAVYRLMPAIAESALALDKRELLAELRSRLARDSALLGHAVGLGWVSVIDGELAHREGSPEVAVSCLRQAIMTLEGVPFPFDAARIRLRLARVLQAQGCVDEATFEAKAALQVFDRLKAYPSAEEARVLLKSLGARVAAPRSSQWFKGLTKTELDVTKLVARRLSNKEIGAKLGISPRTVGTHLQNIFPKTGVHNRTALGDLAREQGLHGDD